jgi:hypothetical protein
LLRTIAENRAVCGICASEHNVRYAPTYFGAQGSLTFDANRWFGVTVDAGGQYRRNDLRTEWLHAYELMGGPQFTHRSANVDVFAHAMAGVVHGLARGAQETFPGAGFGGGTDFHGTGPWAIRLQADYLPNFGSGITFNDVRFGAGIVLDR